MPELPEVETIKRQLEKAIKGKRIKEVYVHKARVIKEPSVAKFKSELVGKTIKNILRKAKALILGLSSGKSLIIHLRMTGQLIYPGDGKSSRVSFLLSDGKLLDFNDRRLLGELRVVDNWQNLAYIRELGPEPFDLDVGEFKKMLSKKTTKIKPLLMDQKFLAGVGNLYAAEALFRAGINPSRRAPSLSEKEIALLLRKIKDTLDEAIRFAGSSVDQYVQLSGEEGGYVAQHKVYDREGKPCVRCKTPIRRITLGGRGTYFCPKCQK